MSKTFSSYSFGCRVNQAEKEMLDRQLSEIGFQYSVHSPDIYIINTCAVTKKAEREARQLIYQTKRKWRNTKIIVTGCAATKWINEGIKFPDVDWLIDNINKEYIAQLLSSKIKAQRSNPKLKSQNDNKGEAKPRVSILETDLSLYNNRLFESRPNWPISLRPKVMVRPEKSDTEALSKQENNNYEKNGQYLKSKRLLLKIQDGCQRFCTFCIVPYLRGQPKSTKINEIVKTINTFAGDASEGLPDVASPALSPTKWSDFEAKSGTRERQDPQIQEVIITAINTQAYGFDTGESFINLIKAIIDKTEIPRISFGSIHPWSINDDFLNLYRKLITVNRLVSYFHIPLQSGSNKILQLMKRGYTREEFIEKLKTLEKIYPLSFIGTDIMAGFLEETDRDFEDTYNFLRESPISKFHVFRFSKREKTAAFYMGKSLNEPSPSQKAKRAKALIELSNIKYHHFLKEHVNRSFPALFLERRIDGYQEALMDNQVPVLIKTDKNMCGEIKPVTVRKLQDDNLTGILAL